MNPNSFVLFAHSIPLQILLAFSSGVALLLTVPSIGGVIVGLLWGMIRRAVRERGVKPSISWRAIGWLLIRAWAISVLLLLPVTFGVWILLHKMNLPAPDAVHRPGGWDRWYVAAAAAALLGFALNVFLARASVVRPFALNAALRALDTGMVLCALLVHLGYVIGFVVWAAVAKDFYWAPYVFAVIGGLIGFLLPFCRMCLVRLSAGREQEVSGDEGAHNE
ncbi:MAG: hypothetical protein H8E44_39375 [Planctomycetes bacterium]|nr:hypothetical protein [Planctomycetota bacterium]MBL7042429.1 hypothetical protein [Pirellulaceae bacterium]